MRFRKNEDFALLLMGELTKHPTRRVTIAHIARMHGVSLLYLKKIVRNLKQAGLVHSKEGATGGYLIARSPRTISVWDVLDAVATDRVHLPDSVHASHICPVHEHCLPQTIRRRVRGVMEAEFRALSLHDLVRS